MSYQKPTATSSTRARPPSPITSTTRSARPPSPASSSTPPLRSARPPSPSSSRTKLSSRPTTTTTTTTTTSTSKDRTFVTNPSSSTPPRKSPDSSSSSSPSLSSLREDRLSSPSARERSSLSSATNALANTTLKEKKGEGETKAPFRKRLPPRLILGDEKDESYSIRFSPDGQFVVAGGGDGGIRVYNSSTGKLTYHLVSEDNLPVTCLRFRPNAQYLTTKNILVSANAAGTVRHWHVTSGKCVHTITETDNQVYAVDFRPDAERFATAGKDFKVRIYDETKRSLVTTLSGGHGDVTAGHASRVFSLKFNPTQPDILISGGWDNTIQIWDTRMSFAVRSIFGPHVCGDAVDIYGETVLSGSWRPEKALQVWDFGSGRLIDTLDWRPAMGEEPCLLYAAQFSKGNGAEYIAAGGSGANEAKIFNTRTKQVAGEIYGFRKGIYSIDFSYDSKMLIVGGSGILQLFELHLTD